MSLDALKHEGTWREYSVEVGESSSRQAKSVCAIDYVVNNYTAYSMKSIVYRNRRNT